MTTLWWFGFCAVSLVLVVVVVNLRYLLQQGHSFLKDRCGADNATTLELAGALASVIAFLLLMYTSYFSVELKFVQLDDRITRVESRLTDIYSRITHMESSFDSRITHMEGAFDSRIGKLETAVTALGAMVSEIKSQMAMLIMQTAKPAA